MAPPFRSYSGYLRQRYGKPVYRVSVDGGFSCPNRGGDRTRPGCAYCDPWGARAPYLTGLDHGAAPAPGTAPNGPPVEGTPPAEAGRDLERRKASLGRQIAQAEAFLAARYGEGPRILYFQAFSGTYAPTQVLRELYDHALGEGAFVELIVSTRPDCIGPEVADLLAGYRRPDREVWVELGLQSVHDRTLARIRRGHTASQFRDAFSLLRGRGLKLAAHVIFGLPGEDLEDMLETVRTLAALEIDGLKIHNLHVPRDCLFAAEAAAGELTVPCDRRHLVYTMRALELVPPHTVIMRLTCDTPPQRLLMPRHFMPKPQFYQALRKLMAREGTWQGRLYRPGGA